MITAAIGSCACLSPSLFAQGWQGQAQFSISWNDTGNKNGLVEPGEKAEGKITIAFDPPAGGTVTFPNGAKAEVKALKDVTLGLLTMQNGASGFLNWTRPDPWIKGSAPTTLGPGEILWIESFQLGPAFTPNPDLSNPAHVLTIFWDPQGNYTPREVKYYVDGIGSNIFTQIIGDPSWNSAMIFEALDSPITSFQVVPAPGLGTCVLMASGLLLRRRRR